MVYGFIASVLPVWLLLAPRDYLSAFMKIGTILLLGVAIIFVMPQLKMPAVTQFIDGSGPVFAGKLFPFAFITIACGAVSGFHALISSGTSPKMIRCEPDARLVGYGSMLAESLVGVMAMIAAATLDPGVYFAMNVGPATLGATSASAAQAIAQWGFTIDPQQLDALAAQMGEATLLSRTGGAPSLAVGMAGILGNVFSGPGLALWYHFAIMFEAVFILTTIDAGTRVGRFMLQELLGHVSEPLGRTSWYPSILFSSFIVVIAWGYFLYQGVVDPLGGINSLWPLFGIANQLLAAVALCVATTVLAKMGKLRYSWVPRAAARMAGGGDADRRMAEGVLTRSEARVPLACAVARGLDQSGGGADDLQRSHRRGARVVLHGDRGCGDPCVGARVVSDCDGSQVASGERGALRQINAGRGERVG